MFCVPSLWLVWLQLHATTKVKVSSFLLSVVHFPRKDVLSKKKDEDRKFFFVFIFSQRKRVWQEKCSQVESFSLKSHLLRNSHATLREAKNFTCPALFLEAIFSGVLDVILNSRAEMMMIVMHRKERQEEGIESYTYSTEEYTHERT